MMNIINSLVNVFVFLVASGETFVSVAGDSVHSPNGVYFNRVFIFSRCENCFQLLTVELMYNSSFYPVVLGVSGQFSIGVDSLNITAPSALLVGESGSSHSQDSVRQSLISDTLKLLFATDSVHRSVFDSLQTAAEALNIGGICSLLSVVMDLCDRELQRFYSTSDKHPILVRSAL
jgi:hypothetical protein